MRTGIEAAAAQTFFAPPAGKPALMPEPFRRGKGGGSPRRPKMNSR
jgi:hypothetical protein